MQVWSAVECFRVVFPLRGNHWSEMCSPPAKSNESVLKHQAATGTCPLFSSRESLETSWWAPHAWVCCFCVMGKCLKINESPMHVVLPSLLYRGILLDRASFVCMSFMCEVKRIGVSCTSKFSTIGHEFLEIFPSICCLGGLLLFVYCVRVGQGRIKFRTFETKPFFLVSMQKEDCWGRDYFFLQSLEDFFKREWGEIRGPMLFFFATV